LLRQGATEVLYPGHPDLPEVQRGAPDLGWMPEVARRGLLVVTRDRRIRTRPAELRTYWEFGIRSVWLAAQQDMGPADQIQLFLRFRVRLEREAIKRGSGPWALAMTPSGVRPLNLPEP